MKTRYMEIILNNYNEAGECINHAHFYGISWEEFTLLFESLKSIKGTVRMTTDIALDSKIR